VQPELPIPLSTARADYPCVGDATSNVGLRPLQRLHPDDWHLVLQAGPTPLTPTPTTTLAKWMRSGAGGYLLPDASASRGLRKLRGVAAWVQAAVGRTTLEEWDDEELEVWREEHAAAVGKVRSGELIGRDCSLLRRVVWDGQQAAGMKPLVARSAPATNERLGRKLVRSVTLTELVSALLKALARLPRAMLMVALVAGCGLLEIEALRLRAEDIDLARGRVRVAGGPVRGRPGLVGERWVSMPRWVIDILWHALPGLATMAPDALLFPCRDDPTRPRSSFGRAIRQAAEHAGLTPHPKIGMRIYSLTALRRLAQALLRESGAPRALVRGTVPRPADRAEARRQEATVERASRALAANWITLVHPPRVPHRLHLPRKAPKGVGPLEPEVTRRPRGTMKRGEVPWSSREDAPMLVPVPTRGSRQADSSPPARPRRSEPVRPPDARGDNAAVYGLLGLAGGYLLYQRLRGEK